MSSWLSKLFGIGQRRVPQQIQKTKVVKEIAKKVEPKVEPLVPQAEVVRSKSLGELLDYGKWYYGVDTKAEPTVRRFLGCIEKRYPCKDGGELVLTYRGTPGKGSRLSISKVGNPDDANRGDWYKSFYSDIAIKHYKDRFGEDATKIVKKQGAMKQILSTQNGRTTEDVHVPLKRWQRIIERFGFGTGKREVSDINPWNPRDFDRFCD